MESTGVAREPEPLDGCARSNSHLNRGSAAAPPTAVFRRGEKGSRRIYRARWLRPEPRRRM